MKKSFKNQFRDQLGHLLYGAVIAAILLLPGKLPRFYPVIITALVHIVREVEQYYHQDNRVLMIKDRLLDVSMGILGAVIMGFIL